MKRLLPFVVLIVVVLGGIVSVPFLLSPEKHRTEITDKLSAFFKHPVVIGQLSMSYWPPALHLEKVAVMNESGTPFLQIDRVNAPLDVSSLMHFRFVPTEIQLDHAVYTTHREASGGWDFQRGASSNASPVTVPASLPLNQVSWKDSQVQAVDSFSAEPQTLTLEGIEGKWDVKQGNLTTTAAFSGLGSPAHLSLSAKGPFLPSPQGSADLELTDGPRKAAFHIEKKPGQIDIKGGAGQWMLSNALAFEKFYSRGATSSVGNANPRLLENWQVHIHREGDRMTVEHSAIVGGGLTEAKGTIENRTLHADIALKDVPADAVWSALGEPIALDGKVTALAKDIEVNLSTMAPHSLKGQGYAEVSGGTYKIPEATLRKLAKAKTLTYFKNKYPDSSAQGIPVQKLSAHWLAKDGSLSTDDGLFLSPEAKAGWVGTFDLERRGFDGYIRLSLHEKNPKLLRMIPAKYQSQPAFGRVQGSWNEWMLRSVPSSKIPSKVQANLSKASRQK